MSKHEIVDERAALQAKTVEFYKDPGCAEWIGNNLGAFSPRWCATLTEFCLRLPSGLVLDVGCGPGLAYQFFGIGSSAEYIGVDISPPLLEIARRKFPRGDFRVGDAADLKAVLKEEKASGFISLDCLKHIAKPNLPKVLDSVRAVVKTNAFGLLNMPLGFLPHVIRGEEIDGAALSLRRHAMMIECWEPEELVLCLESAGFKVLDPIEILGKSMVLTVQAV